MTATALPTSSSAPRRFAALATCVVTAATVAIVGLAAPAAVGAPHAAPQPAGSDTKSLTVLWAEARPSSFPPNEGTLTVGGTYTCTTGGTVSVSFTALQLMPTALPAGSGFLPCGPGVVDAYWEVTSLATSGVHHGNVSVFAHFDGAGQPPKQLTA